MINEVQQSVATLKKWDRISAPDRAEVEAFATLWAFHSHWPSRSTHEIENLIAEFPPLILDVEKSRCLKQRRVA